MSNKTTNHSDQTASQEELLETPDASAAAHDTAPVDSLQPADAPAEAAATEVTDAEAVADQADLAALEAELVESRARTAELTDQLQRMAAEFQNSRRRQEKQLAEEIERAGAHMIRQLLPIVDDFDRAFANVPVELDAAEAWVEGFRQIQKKLHGLLEEQGVEQVATSGEFDPSRHEAISSEPSEEVPAGHILETLRTGYLLKGRVLRPALVRVAS